MLAWSDEQKVAFIQYRLSKNGEVGVRFGGVPPRYFSHPCPGERWACYEVVERLETEGAVTVRCRYLGTAIDVAAKAAPAWARRPSN
jgi:hypothetical protein